MWLWFRSGVTRSSCWLSIDVGISIRSGCPSKIHIYKVLTCPPFASTTLDARSCVTCDKVLAELEKIDDDTDSFGVDFVKINDKRLAKQYGIKNFPALTYFR